MRVRAYDEVVSVRVIRVTGGGGLKTQGLCEYMSTTRIYFKKKQSH